MNRKIKNTLKNLQALACILAVIAAAALGLYVGLWFCFIGGIVMVIEGAKATPVNSLDIALGLLRFVFSAIAGWGTFLAGGFLASTLWPSRY